MLGGGVGGFTIRGRRLASFSAVKPDINQHFVLGKPPDTVHRAHPRWMMVLANRDLGVSLSNQGILISPTPQQNTLQDSHEL